MKVAIQSFIFPDKEKFVKYCHEVGVHRIGGNLRDIREYNEKGVTRQNLEAYLNRYRRVGLSVSVFGWIRLLTREGGGKWFEGKVRHNDGKPSKKKLETIENLGQAGIEIVSADPNFVYSNDEEERAEQEKYAVEYYSRLVEKAEKVGVKLMWPTHHWKGQQVPEPWFMWNFESEKAFLDAVPSEYHGILFCVGSFQSGGEDAAEAIRKFGHRIFYVHARDCKVVPTEFIRWGEDVWFNWKGERMVNAMFGDGIVDWPRVIDALAAIGYKGDLMVEHIPKVLPHILGDDGLPLKSSNGYITSARNVAYLQGILDAKGLRDRS